MEKELLRADVRAATASVEALLTYWVEDEAQRETALVAGKEVINRHYKAVRIDTRNEQELKILVAMKLEEFLSDDANNTINDFIEFETEKALDYQQYYPKRRLMKKEEKAMYYDLARWIEAIKVHTPLLRDNKEEPIKALVERTDQKQPNFKNNFDTIAPDVIYKHFKTGLVDKGYLTEQELNDYLKAAFEFKTSPETLFKIKDAPTKATIEAVFYKYYKNVSGKIHGKQSKYAALLGDYFEGYNTATLRSNFSKSVY